MTINTGNLFVFEVGPSVKFVSAIIDAIFNKKKYVWKYCIVGGYFLMVSVRCPIVLRIFKASRPSTSLVRCIDGICGSGRVFSKHFQYKNCHHLEDLKGLDLAKILSQTLFYNKIGWLRVFRRFSLVVRGGGRVLKKL